jgi:hypothetical protein
VDQNYDLNKDIDLTMNVGGKNLALPMGSTEKMLLSKFVKVNDSELLYEEEEGEHTGEYKLLKGEEMEGTNVEVKGVTIDVKDTPLEVKTFPLDLPAEIAGIPIDQRIVEIDDLSTKGSLILENDGMPKEIVSISEFIPKQDKSAKLPQLSLMFNIDITDGNDQILENIRVDNIILEDFTLTFPDFLFLTDGVDGKGELSENVYTMDDATSFASGEKIFSLDLKSISFKNEDGGKLVIQDQRLYLAKEIRLESKVAVKLSSSSVPAGKLKIKLTPVITIDDILIESVSGQVDPDIDIKSTTVELEGLPDFLQDDKVRLDLANPQIFLTVDNPIGIPILINATIYGKKDNVEICEINTGDIQIPASQKTTIILSKLGTMDDPAAIENPVQYHRINNLNELFSTIPQEIKLDINAQADQRVEHIINLGQTYPIAMDYKIDIPLSFGPDLTIIYNKTIDGWNDQIKDLDMGNISIATTVENTIPLKLKIEGYAIDVDGKKLEGLSVKLNKVINAGKGTSEKSVKTSIAISISEEKKHSGIMKEMDGVVLTITANATKTVNGIPLNSSQYMIMQKISAKITDGMNIDLN